ncbi:MAG: MFS transporter [Acidobacteriota bacterium]|nr:MFS transporter [Acidobacteriota bacterium]
MARPTHVRYSIVALATAVNLLCYADRSAIAVAVPVFQKELGFSPLRTGWVLGIFSLAYALGQTPWGMVADRYGSRLLIAGSILSWSVFTSFTGLAHSFIAMLAIRFSFGGLEAALSPSTAVAFTRWTPVTERSTAFGVFLSGGRLGAALMPSIAILLMLRFGWRAMFVVIGLLGIPAALVWLFWFRDDPSTHLATNTAEQELLAPRVPPTVPRARISWAVLLRSSRLWNLLAVSFTTTFLWQFYITWFPAYLIRKRGLPLREAGFYASLPFLFGVAGAWAGGLATDYLTRHVSARRARLWVGCFGLTMTASLMLIGVLVQVPRLGALIMATAAFTADLFIGAIWSSAVEIGGAAAGAVAGLNNAVSNVAAFAFPILMGLVLQWNGSWNTLLVVGICSTYLGAFLWTKVNPV